MRFDFSKMAKPSELKRHRYSAGQIYSTALVYRRLLSYVKPYKYAFIFAMFGNLLFGAIDSGFVKLIEPLLNK